MFLLPALSLLHLYITVHHWSQYTLIMATEGTIPGPVL